MRPTNPVWGKRCLSRDGRVAAHVLHVFPVPGGGTEIRCSSCDRTEPELEALHA